MFGKKEDRSVTVNGKNTGIINTGDNVTIESPHIIPKALTTQTGLANDIDFVGRKEELQKVDELLNQNATLLLLNGIGGIGKSTLASYYLNQKKDEFDYYGFVQVNDDIKLSLASAFSTSLDLKSEKIDDLFAEIMNKLQNLEGKKLLIIDDVKEMNNQLDEMNTLMTLKNSGFQILFTSREVKEDIPQYFLDIITLDEINYLYRGVSKRLDKELNEKIRGKGNKEEVAIPIGRYHIRIGDFVIGADRENTVRLHHIESGLEDGCVISTTKSLKVAKEFATNKYTEDGYIYIFNRDILEEYSIKAIEINNPLYPSEVEISLIVSDCKQIPKDVIIAKIEISKKSKGL